MRWLSARFCWKNRMDAKLLVSVVVPTYKRPDLLARCMDALLAQDICPSGFEIIVADDAVSRDTERQIECLAARCNGHGPPIRYVPVPTQGNHGPAAARN